MRASSTVCIAPKFNQQLTWHAHLRNVPYTSFFFCYPFQTSLSTWAYRTLQFLLHPLTAGMVLTPSTSGTCCIEPTTLRHTDLGSRWSIPRSYLVCCVFCATCTCDCPVSRSTYLSYVPRTSGKRGGRWFGRTKIVHEKQRADRTTIRFCTEIFEVLSRQPIKPGLSLKSSGDV